MIVAMTLAEPLVAALRVCPTGPQAEEIGPMPAAVAEPNWSPVFPNRLPAAVNPACPTLAAAVAGSWSLACPMPAAVAEPNWSPVFPNRLPAAAHSGPRRRAAVSLAYPMHQLVALAAPRDYRSPAPVDSSHLAQPVVLGVANQ